MNKNTKAPNNKMFSEEEKKFIVKAFGRNSSSAAVRREFLKHNNIKGRASTKYKLMMFIRVNDHFDKYGSIATQTPTKRMKKKSTEATIHEVKTFLVENPTNSLRKTEQQLSIKKTTLWRIVRHSLDFKFYHITSVQPLTEAHKEQRLKFCEWILAQPADFVQKVVWTDEKFFCLHQKHHRKNDGRWSAENPREIMETNNRNDLKVMIFVAIVDGKIPIIHAFLDEDGHLVSVNGSCYLTLLRDSVWPKLRYSATRRGLWWMQDGAPSHCTTVAKEFLKDKFQGRVISRGTEIPWPAHSPDLNPLDFHFWAAAQKQVYSVKPASIGSLVECVKEFAEGYSENTIRNVCNTVLKRARLCLQAGGGHFQHLL